MCRRVLHTGRNLPVTVALANVIKRSFPDEYTLRDQEGSGGDESMSDLADLPVFVMASIMPGEMIALNIFEPRYRLMFRRCMEGNRKLAMTCALRVRVAACPAFSSLCTSTCHDDMHFARRHALHQKPQTVLLLDLPCVVCDAPYWSARPKAWCPA